MARLVKRMEDDELPRSVMRLGRLSAKRRDWRENSPTCRADCVAAGGFEAIYPRLACFVASAQTSWNDRGQGAFLQ